MIKLYVFSKSIHRILALIMVVSTFIMAGTGLIMKYNILSKFFNLDLGLVRFVHNNFSIVFATVLFFMMLTGLVMYLYPIVRRKQ